MVNCLCQLQDFEGAHSRANFVWETVGNAGDIDAHLMIRFRSLAAVASYNADHLPESIQHLQHVYALCDDDVLLAGVCQNLGAYHNAAGKTPLQ